MTMAIYDHGYPVKVPYTPGAAIAAGDVIVIGGVPMITHLDNPPYPGGPIKQGDLSVSGGVYIVAADAAYPNGTPVLWDTAKQQVTTVAAATTFPFGEIIAGPLGAADDGGPVGAASLCYVLHNPGVDMQGGLPLTEYAAIATNTPATPTGAQFAGAQDVTINLTAVLLGAGTLNTPTAVQIVAAIPGAQVGQTYKLRIINSSAGAFAWTVTAAAGVTLNGTMTIAQGTWRDFYVTLTSLTAVALQERGTGTQS
jgi:hypothetical protein